MSRLKKQKEQVEETEIEEEELKTAVLIFAHYLGINIDNEAELLYIAEDALKKLPKGWELGIGDGDDNGGIPYFFNGETGESRWKHPDEIKIMEKVKLEQRKLKETKKQNKHRDKDKNTEKNTNSSSAIETKKGKPSSHSIASNISSVDVLDVKDLSDDDIETEIGTNKPSVRQLSVNSTSKSNDKTLGKSSTWLSSRSSNLKTELKSSTGSKIESTEDSEHIRRLHKRELDELKEYLNTTENSLREERSKRMALELELGSTRSTLELQSRKQSAEHETKLIELREEINMNNKSKRLLLEQRFESEVEALRTDLELHKSRLNETERERDAAKVQAAVGRLNDEKYQESLLELQELRIKLKADTDKANGALDSEKKCLQSEVSDLNDKLAVALHERSILRADLDQAITRATSFSGEKDSLQMALSEAVQKLQTQENRHRQLEDEIAALRRDIKNQTDELNAARKAIAENLGPSSATTKSNIEVLLFQLLVNISVLICVHLLRMR